MTIQQLIQQAGGNAKFSRLRNVPVKTIEGWKSGKRCPPYMINAWMALAVYEANNGEKK